MKRELFAGCANAIAGALLLLLASLLTPLPAFAVSLEDRIEAQRAIERVYYNNRIWPKENPTPKPPFESVYNETAIRQKVEDYLKKSALLESFWNRPITGSQLQAEIDRIIRHSKDPERLKELFAALDNDPFLITECLARPVLTERLIRNWYAFDERIHGALRQEAYQLQKDLTFQNFRQKGGNLFTPVEVRISKNRDDDRVNAIDPDAFKEMSRDYPPSGSIGNVEETSEYFIIRMTISKDNSKLVGGRIQLNKRPFQDWFEEQQQPISFHDTPQASYSLLSFDSIPAAPDSWRILWYAPEARYGHASVWTGSEVIIWGGINYNTFAALNTGGRYNPSLDSWTPITIDNAPIGRLDATAVWTGSEMIVWGGQTGDQFGCCNIKTNTGGRYTPVSDSWLPVQTLNAPDPRSEYSAIWTGTQMVIWGGLDDDDTLLKSGSRYNPSLNSWTPTSTATAPSPRKAHTAVWTGSQMLVWGGRDGTNALNSGAKYIPNLDSWIALAATDIAGGWSEHTAVWTGSEMLIWGGNVGNIGRKYNPSLNSWATISDTAAPSSRSYHTAVWTGSEMIIWGGIPFVNTGGRYDPSLDSWIATSVTNAPTARFEHTAVWSGSEMIVWGGSENGNPTNTGARFDPTSNSWLPTASSNAPSARSLHSAVWTGSEMIIWGGYDRSSTSLSGNLLNTGGMYDPSLDSWSPTSTTNAPSPRALHTAIWSGSEMITWGGRWFNGVSYLETDSGAKYNPVFDSWTATSTTAAASARFDHSAIWTGTEMIVWGGQYFNGSAFVELDTGGKYNAAADSWVSTSGANAPSPRKRHLAIWAGSEMIVWGGVDSGGDLNTGGKYAPGLDTWVTTPVLISSTSGDGNTAVWTGSEMIVWGGTGFGGKYNPGLNTWSDVDPFGAPSLRSGHTAVWTGAEMIVWGGGSFPGLNTGGRYVPGSDSWTPTSLLNAPSPRFNHTAIWTGSQMIIWEGDAIQNGGVYYTNTAPQAFIQLSTSSNNDTEFLLGAGESLTIDGSSSTDGSNPAGSPIYHDTLDSIFRFEWDMNDIADCAGIFEYEGPIINLSEEDLKSVSIHDPGDYRIWFRVTDEAGATSCTSAVFTIVDGEPPAATLLSPDGGESWAYSESSLNRKAHLIVWTSSDNFPPIDRTKLSYTTNGVDYTCIADSDGTDCPAAGLSDAATSFLWEMPTQAEAVAASQIFPTASARIRVEVWDSPPSNNQASDTSTSNFYIVQPTTTAIRTLILWNSARMTAKYGAGPAGVVASRLVQLRDHNKVDGFIIDLDSVPAIQSAYSTWDASPTNQDLANNVASAIRSHLVNEITNTYTNTEYLILVGDDRQIPFYRMQDGTSIYTESNYVGEVTLNTSTTVGSAIQAGRILTDNYYAELAPEASGLSSNPLVYLNDLAAGRLVETPDQIEKVINTFLEQDGQLNVSDPSEEVLVAAHDFLYDSAVQIRSLYGSNQCLLDNPATTGGGNACVNVEYNSTDLQNELFSNPAHLISNINDHANHFSFSTSAGNLSTTTMYADGDHLRGTVVYSPGCHSGLPAPEDDTNPLDLPELMAEKRAVSYMANTGYGWGLEHGVGLSEALMRHITRQIVESGSITTGQAMAQSKRQYYVEERRYDVFDEKVLHALTLYGIPNYLIVTDSSLKPSEALSVQSAGDCGKGMCVQSALSPNIGPPGGVIQLNANFLFGDQQLAGLDPQVFQLINAGSDGTYYQLEGEASGETGDTLQPRLVFDSRLPNVHARGAMFTGGQYVVINNFNPVVAVPRSTNQDEGEGPIPGRGSSRPRTRISTGGGIVLGPITLAAAAAEQTTLNTMVADAGYFEGDSNLGTEYVFKNMSFAIFYFDSQDATDVTPPVLTPAGDGDFHTISGSDVNFAVMATDSGTGVHAVVITYDNPTTQSWESLQLVNAGGNTWTGSLPSSDLGSYYVQAVDNRGNVAEYSAPPVADLDGAGAPYGSEWSAPVILEVSGGSSALFFDDFADAGADDWSLGPGWAQTAGELRATTSKKTDALALPAFAAGCSECSIETIMRIDTAGGVTSLFGWYQNGGNMVEIMLMDEKNKILLKQKAGGTVVAKSKFNMAVNVGVNYKVRVQYASGFFQLFVDDVPVLQDVSTPVVPSGTVGFRVKSTTGAATTGSFQEITVE